MIKLKDILNEIGTLKSINYLLPIIAEEINANIYNPNFLNEGFNFPIRSTEYRIRGVYQNSLDAKDIFSLITFINVKPYFDDIGDQLEYVRIFSVGLNGEELVESFRDTLKNDKYKLGLLIQSGMIIT